jgi:hypothetical protein
MYFPQNREFGLAVSKLRNFGGEGCLNPPNPRRYATGSHRCRVTDFYEASLKMKLRQSLLNIRRWHGLTIKSSGGKVAESIWSRSASTRWRCVVYFMLRALCSLKKRHRYLSDTFIISSSSSIIHENVWLLNFGNAASGSYGTFMKTKLFIHIYCFNIKFPKLRFVLHLRT